MVNGKYSNFLTIILIISSIAIIILIGYFGYDIYRKYKINKEAEEAVDAFQEQFVKNNNIYSNNNTNENTINNVSEDNPDNTNSNENTNNNGNSGNTGSGSSYVSKTNYSGYTMLGTIEIPKINLKTPVIKELTVDSLKKATILIYGNLNEEGNSVIIGHNNRNGTFFSNLKKLSSGDTITITDYSGEQVNYKVYSVFQASPDDTSFYQRNTNGLREISLSTCTDNDDTKRIIVLAREV